MWHAGGLPSTETFDDGVVEGIDDGVVHKQEESERKRVPAPLKNARSCMVCVLLPGGIHLPRWFEDAVFPFDRRNRCRSHPSWHNCPSMDCLYCCMPSERTSVSYLAFFLGCVIVYAALFPTPFLNCTSRCCPSQAPSHAHFQCHHALCRFG